ncbi:MAG: MFS transporter [Verrucomicrobiota bacterium]
MKTDLKTSPPTAFPAGVTNANWFSFFNAVSFQIFLGPPLILYAKSLGASATLLGLLGSLTPLLTVFQIPAAHHIQRFGYRRFILAGWSTRNLCVFAVVAIPLLGFLSNGWKLALLVGFQFLFNLLRGISSGAWLPWLTEILPEEIRARFLSRDQRFMQTGSLAALLFCGLVLQKESQPWEFALAFLISAIGGAASLFYLNRVPDVEAQESLKKSGTRVPWATIVTYPPFARVLGFNLLFAFTVGSLGVFSVSFLKGRAGLGENNILFLMAVSFIAAVASLGMVGRLLDAIGSKRLLRWALALYMVYMAGWVGIASGLIGPSLLLLLFVLGGVAGSAINLANVRLIMGVMPEMGRAHFFAAYTVITSLCLGFSPILWGLCLDAMNGLKVAVGPHGAFEWNRYSVYFTALLFLAGATFLAAAALVETQPRPSEVK